MHSPISLARHKAGESFEGEAILLQTLTKIDVKSPKDSLRALVCGRLLVVMSGLCE